MKKQQLVVVVVLLVSILFALSVVQGEEVEVVKKTSVIRTSKDNIEAVVNESMEIITAHHEEIKRNEVLNAKALKEEIIKEEIAMIENTIEDQVLAIMEATPLNEEDARIVLRYSKEYNFNPSFILGIMDLESNFNKYLVGGSQDRGFMQVIPGTEKWLVDTYGKELGFTYNPDRIFETEYNLGLALKYLEVLRIEFDGDFTKMLTAYNRGSGGLRKWYAEHNTYETAYSRVVLKREEKYLDINK